MTVDESWLDIIAKLSSTAHNENLNQFKADENMHESR
jgi:hypothetical protein